MRDFKKSTYGKEPYKSTWYEKEVNGVRFTMYEDSGQTEENKNKAINNMKYIEKNIKGLDKDWKKEVTDYVLQMEWLDNIKESESIKLEAISTNRDGSVEVYYGDGYPDFVLGGHVVDFDYNSGDEKNKKHFYDMHIEG